MCVVAADSDGVPDGWMVDEVTVDSPALGESWRVLVQRPAGSEHDRLPWLWLLHGSTASADDVRSVLTSALHAMNEGDIPPMIIAAPDAPDGYRSSWWVDSTYEPADPEPRTVGESVAQRGRPLELALLGDVLPAIEERFGPPSGATERTIGGISMGGAAALRWLLVRPDLFGSAVLLSPAVYNPSPSLDSSARATGAFGTGRTIFDPERFRELMHYPTLLDARPSAEAPTSVVIVVGDEEPVQFSDVQRCDLDLEAARLHATLKDRKDFRSRLRVLGGAHDWPLWERGIVTALRVLADRE